MNKYFGISITVTLTCYRASQAKFLQDPHLTCGAAMPWFSI